jgi:hypothetical protein
MMTIDTHHHLVPDFLWQATENAHVPVGGLAPLRWSKEASISFMDDAGVDAKLDIRMGMPHGSVTNVDGFIAARQAFRARGAFLTERLT